MAEIADRYSRQARFPPIGPQGQKQLGSSRVTVVGCGALGALSASWLVRAGVGHLRILDRDLVEESNLQRQILFDQEDVRRRLPKAVAAERHLGAINPEIRIEGIVADLNWRNIDTLIDPGACDLILDGTDNFETRFLLNDHAVRHAIPWIYGACVGSYGITLPIIPGKTPCLRCLLATAPPPGSTPTCDQAGILAAIAGVIASHQTSEALKILTGNLEKVCGELLTVDLWENRWMRTRAGRSEFPGPCVCCTEGRFEYLEGEKGAMETTLCGRESVQILPADPIDLDLEALSGNLKDAGRIERNRFLLRLELPEQVLVVFPDGRALISGTKDPAVARSLYARYVGS